MRATWMVRGDALREAGGSRKPGSCKRPTSVVTTGWGIVWLEIASQPCHSTNADGNRQTLALNAALDGFGVTRLLRGPQVLTLEEQRGTMQQLALQPMGACRGQA
jgi:hypothetical protein